MSDACQRRKNWPAWPNTEDFSYRIEGRHLVGPPAGLVQYFGTWWRLVAESQFGWRSAPGIRPDGIGYRPICTAFGGADRWYRQCSKTDDSSRESVYSLLPQLCHYGAPRRSSSFAKLESNQITTSCD